MKICPTCQQTYSDEVEFCPRDGACLAAQATETEAQLAAGLSRRFRIIRRLGQGGMGTVFLAEQIGVGNRPVALKVLNRKLLDDPDFLLRFQNEAGSTGRIHHANVVTIYESAQADDGTPYIAMEFLEGESLREILKRRGALPVTEVAEILQQAARGLSAAHKLGIIHRDLKPDNIFLTYPDDESVAPVSPPAARVSPPANVQVKIVDFGIAKLRESAMHTQTGMVLGTPAYMSYEQASGMRSDELDARSDIYSLGVVVYEMLTGRTPFHSDTPVGYLRMHMQEEPPPFRAVKPDLPALPQLESVVMKALTKDRDKRYSSVLEFARDFAQAAQEAGSVYETGPHPAGRAMPPSPASGAKDSSPELRKEGQAEGAMQTSLRTRVRTALHGFARVPKGRRAAMYWAAGLIASAVIVVAGISIRKTTRSHPPGGAVPSAAPDAAHVDKGNALATKGDWDGAIAEYRQALRLDPKSDRVHFAQGGALWSKGDWKGAIVEEREALRLNPNNDVAHVILGEALRQEGDGDGAIAEYRAALRLNPKNKSAHACLGRLLGNKNDWDGEIAEEHEALRFDPKYEFAHAQLGLAFGNKGDWDGAIAEEREALHLNPKNELAHACLGAALGNKGDWDGDIAEQRAALLLDPNYADAHYLLGWALAQKGERRGALQEYRTAYELDPKNADYRRNYERLLPQKK